MEFGEQKFKLAKEERSSIMSSIHQHDYIERDLQYDITQKLNEKAASDELTTGLDAQVKYHKAKAVKQKMDDYAFNEKQHEYIENGLQYDIAQKLNVKAISEELTSGLDAQVSDHKSKAVKQKMEDYSNREKQHEYAEKGLQYDIAEKLNVKAASDELTSGLNAQVSDQKAKAVKQKMEDNAFSEKQDEYIEKGLQYDIAEKLNVKAASDELTSGLDAQISDHKAEAVKQKKADYAYREKMMGQIEEARLQEEEEKNMIKAKNKIYAADLLQQIEDNKKRRAKERLDM